MCALSVISICVVTYLLHYRHLKMPTIVFAGPFPLWIVFFFEGLFIGRNSQRKYPIKLILALTVVSFILTIVESKYLYSLDGGGAGIKLTSFIFSFFAILLLFSAKVEAFFKQGSRMFFAIFVKIGRLSFGIYLVHYFLLCVLSC